MRTLTIVTCLVAAAASVVAAETLRTDNAARARVLVLKGESALERGNYERAESHFSDATGLMPDLPSAQLGLGAALIGQTRYPEAIVALDLAERQFARLHEAHRLAMLKIQNAIDDARRQVSGLEDDHSVGHMIPNWQGMENDQIEKLNAAQGPPIPAQLYYLLGIARLRTGDLGAGVERLQRCLEVNPQHALAHYNLGVALLAAGEREAAEHHIQQAVQAGVEMPPSLVERLGRRAVRVDSID